MSKGIVWFRNDLRVHDHQALVKAMSENDSIVACYIFDKTIMNQDQFGFKRIGPYRIKFSLEGIEDLTKSLKRLNVPLFVLYDEPLNAFKRIHEVFNFDNIYFHKLVGAEELQREEKIMNHYSKKNVYSIFEKTLLHPEDLIFKIEDIPDTFTLFKQKVEKNLVLRKVCETPTPQNSIHIDAIIDVISMEDFGYSNCVNSRFKGGEHEALKRLNYYLFESKLVSNYKHSRNHLLFDDDTSKFSVYLSQGSLSPRKIVEDLKLYEKKIESNESTYWLFYELLWRDFFIFMHMKHENKLFDIKGFKDIDYTWDENKIYLEKFIQGKTGYPLVDANIKEMLQTGYMSNRGRQNVASFFTKNLGLNWLVGAAFFEMMLIDYDVSSNYGNWAYIAGVGNDNVPFRFFNLETQGERYDSNGDYVKKYLPTLKNLPSHLVYKIHRLNQLDLVAYNIILGKDYPKRIVDFESSIEKRKEVFLKALKK